MKNSCFISYVNAHNEFVRHLSNDLRKLGLRVFCGGDTISHGDNWITRIQEAMVDARIFVLVASPESLASEWVLREINVALSLQQKKSIICIKLHETELLPLLEPYQIGNIIINPIVEYARSVESIVRKAGDITLDRTIEGLSPPPIPEPLLPEAIRKVLVSAVAPLCQKPPDLFSFAPLVFCFSPEYCHWLLDEVPTAELRAQSLWIKACQETNIPKLTMIEANLMGLLQYSCDKLDLKSHETALNMIKALNAPKCASTKRAKRTTTDVKNSFYRNWLEERTHFVETGFFRHSRYKFINLADVYIQQRGRYSYQETDDDQQEPHLIRREFYLTEMVNVARAHGKNGLILVGAPGSGKTTTLRYLAGTLVREDDPAISGQFELLPLFLPLRTLGSGLSSLPKALADYVRSEGTPQFGENFFKRCLENGNCVVMLDGLDELVERKTMLSVLDWLRKESIAFPENNVFIVTCREHQFRTTKSNFPESFLQIDILALSTDDIGNFVNRWYSQKNVISTLWKGTAPAEDVSHEARRLVKAIENSQKLLRLANNPLMLQIIVLVNLDTGSVPQRRVELYRECVLSLAFRWDIARGIDVGGTMEEESVLMTLETIARWLHSKDGRLAENDGKFTALLNEKGELSHGLPSGSNDLFRAILQRDAIFHKDKGGMVSFRHQAFQEYLTASAIVHSSKNREEFKFLAQKAEQPWWREVTELVLEHRRPDTFEPFLAELILANHFETSRELVMDCVRAAEGNRRPSQTVVNVLLDRTASFASRYTALLVLREIGLGNQIKEVREHLSVESGDIQWFAKILLGLRFQDERIHGALPNLWRNPIDGMEFALIPEGQFTMGATDDLQNPQETPSHQVLLDAYYIALHPITNRQYRSFLEAKNHPGPEGRDQWNTWIGTSSPPGLDNHPVVYVSWYDAQDYCEWAGAMLPTEAQWEKAARSTDGRLFPWGDDNRNLSDRINFNNCVGRTTEVGMYPNGVSKYGCFDMVGNVWEWCSDAFDPNIYKGRNNTHNPKGPEFGDRKVDRGGGWQMDQRRCRAAYRSGWPAGQPDCDLGFRPIITVDRVIKDRKK